MKYLLSLLLLIPLLTLASEFDDDTLQVYQSKAVVVTATRTVVDESDVPARVEVLTPQMLSTLNPLTVADVLKGVEGIYVRDYGANAGMKNITIRGFTSSNILVLQNGLPLNTAQYGSYDLSLLNINTVERLEVLQGSGSAFYGGNAAGGVVNLLTRKPSEQFKARASVGGASYGGRLYNLEAEGEFYGVGVLGGFQYENGIDNYSYRVERTGLPDTTENRRNSRFIKRHFYTTGSYNQTKDLLIRTTLEYLNFDRGVPGSITFPSDKAKQKDEVFRAAVHSDVAVDNNILLRIGASHLNSKLNYIEPSLWGNTDILYRNKQSELQAQAEIQVIPSNRIIAGASMGSGILDATGLSWGMPFKMDARRTSTALWLSDEVTYLRNTDYVDRIMLIGALRYDHFSDIEKSALSPKFGINMRIIPSYDLRMWAAIGRNFRVPTFNDLYYPGYSNSQLKPEYSTSYEVGVRTKLDDAGRHSLQASYFFYDVKDKIVLDATWTPYNIGKSEHQGFDSRYEYQSSDLTVYAGVSIVEALKKNKSSQNDQTYNKKLPNVPLSNGVIGININTKVGIIMIQQVFTGVRYIDELNTQKLPDVVTTDVGYSVATTYSGLTINWGISVNNLFDVQYQIYNGYPMPGRIFRTTLKVEY